MEIYFFYFFDNWAGFCFIERNWIWFQRFLGGSDGKESVCNAGGMSSIPGLGRSPEEGNGSVRFSLVMSDILRPHLLQHTRLPCPSPTPGACSTSCPSSWWCHPTISSSVIPFSSHLQPFPASGSFPVGQFFTSGGQSIGASASASTLPMNIQEWFPLGLIGLISLLSKGLSRVFSKTTVQKHQLVTAQLSLGWGAWWAAVYGVAQSCTQLKWFISSSSSSSFLYSPTLTSVHDYWKNHSLD